MKKIAGKSKLNLKIYFSHRIKVINMKFAGLLGKKAFARKHILLYIKSLCSYYSKSYY